MRFMIQNSSMTGVNGKAWAEMDRRDVARTDATTDRRCDIAASTFGFFL
jgi:hypothetical protein